MTPVQISEKIRDHLIAQNAQARSKAGACRYRGENGTMCAVGCLIKDEFYSAVSMEGVGVAGVHVTAALNRSGIVFTRDDQIHDLLSNWQAYHDDIYAGWLAKPDEFSSPQSTHERLMENFGI